MEIKYFWYFIKNFFEFFFIFDIYVYVNINIFKRKKSLKIFNMLFLNILGIFDSVFFILLYSLLF